MIDTLEQVERVIGIHEGNKPGRLIVCTAAMHGNEKTGITALKRVLGYLHNNQPHFAGRLVGIAGNLKAIEENCRYFDVDFNRIWLSETINKVQAVSREVLSLHEEKELKALLDEIEWAVGDVAPGDVVYADLHNTSSSRGLFSVTFNREENLRIGSAINVPMVIGLEKALRGTAIEYFSKRGYTALAFEGGELGKESSVDVHEAGIWMILQASGCIHEDDIPNFANHRRLLKDAAEDFPKLTELAYVHKITPKHRFVMERGFTNFQTVQKGDILAHDRDGIVRAPLGGYILMPLYQEQGDEGFFITKLLDQ